MLLDRGLLERDDGVYRPIGSIGALEVPETLHALIASRLDNLTAGERRLVQDASVVGKTFTKQGLTAHLDAYAAGPDDPDAEEIRAKARETLVRAAERAASLAANLEAQRAYERAIELTDEPLEQADLHERAGAAAAIGARADEASAHFERSLARFEAEGATPARRGSRLGSPRSSGTAVGWRTGSRAWSARWRCSWRRTRARTSPSSPRRSAGSNSSPVTMSSHHSGSRPHSALPRRSRCQKSFRRL